MLRRKLALRRCMAVLTGALTSAVSRPAQAIVNRITRRRFLQSGLGVAGTLVLPRPRANQAQAATGRELSTYVETPSAADPYAFTQQEISGQPQAMANPLDDLAVWSARNVGRYDLDETGAFGVNYKYTGNRIDDSGMVYDRWNKRIYFFGGGHGPCQLDTTIVTDVEDLGAWYNLYQGTPYEHLVIDNLDYMGPALPQYPTVSKGCVKGAFNTDQGWNAGSPAPYAPTYGIYQPHPAAKHTMGNSLVVQHPSTGEIRFYLLSEGMPDTKAGLADTVNGVYYPWGGTICYYSFTDNQWHWDSRYGTNAFKAWHVGGYMWDYSAAAAIDRTNKPDTIVLHGIPCGASGRGIYFYNFVTDTQSLLSGVSYDALSSGPGTTNSASGELVWCPDQSTASESVFYSLTGYANSSSQSPPTLVHKVTIRWNNLATSTIEYIAATGTPPSMPWTKFFSFDWDSDRHKIGGCVYEGVFYEFDPATNAWSSQVLTVEAPKPPFTNPSQSIRSHFHTATYVPLADGFGGYVFCQNPGFNSPAPNTPTTWAVRTVAFDELGEPPGPPTDVMATAGNAQASVSFSPPTDTGGSPITGYTVTSDPAGGVDANAGTTSTTHTITGLVNGTAYTFTATASNAAGSSAPSAPSNSVTPQAAAPVTSYSAPTPTGTGVATVRLSGGGPACGFQSIRFVNVSQVAVPPPSNQSFPHGLLEFTASGATPGSTITLTITYPQAIAKNAAYWKYGPRPPNNPPAWYTLTGSNKVSISGSTVSFIITDGKTGDNDLVANGTIVDPGGIAVRIR